MNRNQPMILCKTFYNWQQRSRWLVVFKGTIVFCACCIPKTLATEKAAYRLGLFPYLPPVRLEKNYAPMAADFASILGRPVQFSTANGFDKFRTRLSNGDFDIALISPLDIVPVVDDAGYIPLARRSSKPASIVVLEDSALQQVVDLRGKTIGLPTDTPASIILQLTLRDEPLLANHTIHFKEFTNVLACLHQLLIKTVDACGSGSGAALRLFQKKMAVKLRVLMKTEAFPHMLFVAKPVVPLYERELLVRAILNSGKTGEDQKFPQMNVHEPEYIPYRSEDYHIIRHYRQRWEKNDKIIP